MRYDLTIGKYDFSIRTTNCGFFEFKKHKFNHGAISAYYGFGLVLYIDDWTAEVYEVCAECGSSEIGEQGYGDEGWTVCPDCHTIEGGYTYVNKRHYEGDR